MNTLTTAQARKIARNLLGEYHIQTVLSTKDGWKFVRMYDDVAGDIETLADAIENAAAEFLEARVKANGAAAV